MCIYIYIYILYNIVYNIFIQRLEGRGAQPACRAIWQMREDNIRTSLHILIIFTNSYSGMISFVGADPPVSPRPEGLAVSDVSWKRGHFWWGVSRARILIFFCAILEVLQRIAETGSAGRALWWLWFRATLSHTHLTPLGGPLGSFFLSAVVGTNACSNSGQSGLTKSEILQILFAEDRWFQRPDGC